ncbi:uncharacterized protein LOC123905413 [Trifolium pratense]|uniref:Uncharacterized protein n=1 Tax=Trifolium pratense TaxID=57577 RepID=A0ACB0K5N1_TRIPR|nr:uncharacterized protein LOC123905413 [Trifolium pratense]CAJ2651912.1 unnamed protein product [Trifolium pratense]
MPSTRSRGERLVQLVSEPERLLRRRNLENQLEIPLPDLVMAEVPQERPLRSYATPSQEEPHNSIAAPAIEANNFELKPSLLSAVQQNQFSGNPTDDPNLHLSIFLQYADTVKANGVSPEAIRLRLFPFLLRDRARAWLQSLPSNSVTSWDELKKVFLARYFPPSKTAMLRAQINGFKKKDNESLFEAWERYKDMIRLCPYHGLENWLIIHTFYNGLLYNTRLTIDAAAGGALMDKPYNQAYQLIESMAQNHYQWGNERTSVEKPQTKGGMYEVNELDLVKAKFEALTQKMESMTTTPAATVAATITNCELCGIQGHTIAECQLLMEVPPDQVNYTQGNPYNQGSRNHPYLSYKSNNALYAPAQAPAQAPPGFQNTTYPAPRKSNLELLMENFITTQAQTNLQTSEQIKQITSKLDVLTTHNKMLETQIAQVAQQQASTSAPTGIFPGQPQPNPRGHVNAVILRSGTQYDGPADPRTKYPAMQPNFDKTTEKESEPKEKQDSGEETKEKEKPYVPPPPYKPPIPYPQRLVQSKNVGQFKKFVELLQKLNITIPFTEAITQMPSYAKFLKDILTNKKKIKDDETVMLTLGELRPTKMSIQFADRSVKYPLGILENVPVRIGQFFIPTDFIVMDIREDSNAPIILGRPFLATAGAIIDVKKGKLTFEVGEEKVEFILTQFMNASAIEDSCYMLDVVKECRKEMEKDKTKNSEILKTLIPPTHKNGNDDLAKCLKKSSCYRLDIAETNVDNTPFKRVPPDILKAHPESNIFQNKTSLFASKKKKRKRKTPMRWFDMFKWRPKDVGHNFKNVSLEEAPY